MGLSVFVGGGGSMLFRCFLLFFMSIGSAAASIVLIAENATMSFDDAEAKFAPKIEGSGECGVLYIAEPLDACTPLTNQIAEGPYSPFVLIIRGTCTFDYKVKSAQQAGFKAVIIYDNRFNDGLVSMAGTSRHIRIPAVFVSRASGEVLTKYAGRSDLEFWIIPTYENAAWSIMAISIISLLAMSAMLATCFFVRRHRIRRERPRASNIREFHGMSGRLVKAMPSLVFTSVLEDNCTSTTCAICLEDYNVGEKLRILPCRHKFHAVCVDAWLTTWRTFCPMCKRDARTSTYIPPPTESTPLLFSAVATPASSMAALSSFRSSLAASSSPSIPLTPTPSVTPFSSRNHSLSRIPPMHYSQRSYSNSPAIRASRSTYDLGNASFERPYLASTHSSGFPSSSPVYSTYVSPCIPSMSNVFPSFLTGSSGRMSYSRHCTESDTNSSVKFSAQSLPGC